MLRRIVLVKPHEYLEEGWQKRSFSAMGIGLASNLKSAGLQLEENLYPVPIFGRRSPNHPATGHMQYGSRMQIGTPKEIPYAVVANFDDQEAIERFKSDKRDDI